MFSSKRTYRVLVNIIIYNQMLVGGTFQYVQTFTLVFTLMMTTRAITQYSRCPGNIFSFIKSTVFYFRRNYRSGSLRRVRLPGRHHYNHRHSYQKVSWAHQQFSLSLSLSLCNITRLEYNLSSFLSYLP